MRVRRQRCGGAAIEQATVLGLICLAVLGAAMTLGAYTQRLITPMTAEHALAAANPGANRTTADRTRSGNALPAHVRWAGADGGGLLTFAVGVLIVIAGGLVLRWSRARPRLGVDRDLPEACCSPDDLLAQLYVKRQGLLRFLENCDASMAGHSMEVRHLMTEDLTIVGRETPLAEVIELMSRKGFRHLVVGQASGEVLGVISDRDLRSRSGSTAGEIMSSPVRSVTPDTPAKTAISYLLQHHISCLPVVEGSRLCGMVTTTDLMLVLQCLLQLCLRSPTAVAGESPWIELAT
jgi:CBS domain-containing protein